MKSSVIRRLFPALLAVVLLAAGCGDDGSGDGGDDESSGATTTSVAEQAELAELAEPEMLDVMVSDTGIEGVPAELPAGAVAVTVAAEADSLDLDFTRVTEGTTEEDFKAGVVTIIEGGPFPEFVEGTAGAVLGESAVVLDPGDYFVWSAGGSSEGEEVPATVDDIVTTELTVTDEDDPATLPEGDNTITAVDYSFDVDVQAGDGFTFVNDGAEQFHHAVVFNFGTSDPAAVEENLVPFLSSEGAGPPPEGLEIDFANFEAGGSGVFSPGGQGRGVGTFEDGDTYAVVCFIQDLGGGAPHVFQENMFEVFTVGDTAG